MRQVVFVTARVLFVTDHEPVEPPDTPMRGAPDPDPVQT